MGVEVYNLQGLALDIALLIVCALLIKANSSGRIAVNVPDLEALGLADSHVIDPVPSDLLMFIYLLFSEALALLNPLGSIHIGRLFIINLAFSNSDLISHCLSTESSF